jgi:hypothetical protein
MKNAKLMLAAMLTILPGLAIAQLANNDRIKANVPFEFVVANKVIPAGECIVRSAGMNARTLAINNVDAKISLLSPAIRADSRNPAPSYTLVFNKMGNSYFLRGIKLEGSGVSYWLPESKAEAEMLARNVPSTEKIVLASLK